MIAEWLMKTTSNMVMGHVVSLVLLLGLNYAIYLRGRVTPLAVSYYIVSIGPFLWLLGKLMKTVAPTLVLRWIGIVIQYLGIASLGPSFFIFCLTFHVHGRVHTAIRAALYIPSVIIFLLIATNPLHHWFYTVFSFYRDSFGPVFYASSYSIYAFLGAGAVLLIVELIRRGRASVGQIALFALAALIPLLASFYYPRIGNIYSGLRFDITPMSFNFSFLCFGIAVFRYDFLDISRIAFGQIMDELPEGLVVTHEDRTVLYSNREGRRLCPEGVVAASGTDDGYVSRHEAMPRGMTALHVLDKTQLAVRRSRIERRTAELEELTADIEQRIDAEREELRMNEANRASQELHDVLGHSLTLIIAQLEGLRFVKSPHERAERLARAGRIMEEGRSSLEQALAGFMSAPGMSLHGQLSRMADSCTTSECRVEPMVRGRGRQVDPDTERNIYAICRESVTNSIRHGRANRILVRVDYADAISVLVLDNGRGCDTIREGVGLRGIRHRAEQMNAELLVRSAPGEGFATRLTVPMK